MTVQVDYSRDSLLDAISIARLKDSYMTKDEVSPQDRYKFVSEKFSSNPAHAQRLYDYASKHWFGYSTPILSFGRNKDGLPISCFLTAVQDTKAGLVDALSETNWLSMLGGGVGVYFNTRGADEKSVGVIPHMKVYDDSCLAFKQGSTRRGSYAMYLDISHPDILEFLEMRKETGDPRRKCLNLHHGVNIPDSFMKIIEKCMLDPEADDAWELKDPASGKVHETVSAKDLWVRLLELRAGQGRGEPYLHFIDNVNNALSPELKKVGYKVTQSNLCNEVELMTDENNTAVCCLSSINLEYWDEYKDNYQFFLDLLEMLDNTIQYFIDHAPEQIGKAKYSAIRERSVGLGVMGYHSYLQKKMIPFESVLAKSLNISIFSQFAAMRMKANLELGALRGEPELLKDSGMRFAHTCALAPTASNALICGNVSPSIEPWHANAFRQDTLSGTFIQKNKHLDTIIKEITKGDATAYDSLWHSVVQNDGSIQEIDEFDEDTKEVFKTAAEIDQMWMVEQLCDRQHFVDQGQSFNIFIRPDISIKRLHAIHFTTWKRGGKGMYYVRSEKLKNTEKVGTKIKRVRIEDDIDMKSIANGEVCAACEG